ncbi:Isoleucine--tRNA ligase [bioreactor metagenome]|uniref:Isoleucine--tRNA ligase n=1 Tax=bioreactor metagenome TaxID=1076179 RepID=A0A645AJ43_9ZZZZ
MNKALELARGEKRIGKSLEAAVTLHTGDGALLAALEGVDLKELCIVSGVAVSAAPVSGYAGESCPGLTVAVAASQAPKCPRCWIHSHEIGQPGRHSELCPRCAAVVEAL